MGPDASLNPRKPITMSFARAPWTKPGKPKRSQVEKIRERQKGAINARQLKFLQARDDLGRGLKCQPGAHTSHGSLGKGSRTPLKGFGVIWLFPQIRGQIFGSPYNKDHNIFGSILGPPIYGSPHIR